MSLTPFHGPPARPPDVPGFVVRTLLGVGAHGEVWAAREQITGEQVALKTGRRPGGEAGDSARAEADLLARLDHPHLVRLRRVVPMPDGGTAMVLDLASGGSLAALVAARGPLEPGEVVTMVVPLATVLAELHGQGVVHGDLAPGNVLFAADGRPLLADLGVSSVLGARTTRAWSTPGFADPALSRGGDPRTGDVWGMGAVAWFALTGRPPLGGASDGPGPDDGVLDVAALDGVRGLPPELGALIRSCLSPLPAARPSLEQVAERAWAALPPQPIRLPFSRPGVGGLPETRAGTGIGPDQESPRLPVPELRWVTARSTARPDAAAALQAPSSSEGPRSAGSVSSASPRRRHLAAAVAGCLLTGAAIVALHGTTPPHRSARAVPAGPVGPDHRSASSAGVSAAQGSPATTHPPSGARASFTQASVTQASVTQALERIGAARAEAFQRVSTKPLAAADEPGSPAEQVDVALVRRLAGSGLRLDGVSYRIGEVRVLASTTELLDVRAVVTTSPHQQLSTSGGQRRRIAPVGPEQVQLRLVRSSRRTPTGRPDRTVKVEPPNRADQPGRVDPAGSDWLVRSVVAVSG